MANHFYGRDGSCHTSNGGGELFVSSLVRLGRALAGTPTEQEVIAFLEQQLRHGNGWIGFNLDPPPVELSSPKHLTFLARIAAHFAELLLANRVPPDLEDEFRGRDFQLRWAAWATDFHALVTSAAGGHVAAFEPVIRDGNERLHFELHRTRNQWADAVRRRPKDHQRLLTLANARTALHEQLVQRAPMVLALLDKAKSLHELARDREAGSVYRQAARYEDDPEAVKDLLELAEGYGDSQE